MKRNSRKGDRAKSGRAAHLPPADREAIVRALRAGAPIAAIAAENGVTKSTVYRIRKAEIGPSPAAHQPTEHVAFRLSRAERDAFDQAVEAAGYRDRSDALRGMVRCSVGMLDRQNAFVGEVKALYSELSAIGVNINQIARAVNRGQAPPLREVGPELQGLKRQLMRVMPALNEVVLEARRSNERLWAASRQTDDGGGHEIGADGSGAGGS